MSSTNPPNTQTTQIEIYRHNLSASQNLINNLKTHYFPYCLPLLRRLQRGLFSETAVLLATFPNCENDNAGHDTESQATTRNVQAGNTNPPKPLPEPFAIGIFDRSTEPGIQGWLFSSIEIPKSRSESPLASYDPSTAIQHQTPIATSTSPINNDSDTTTALATAQLLHLFSHFATHGPPAPKPSTPPPSDTSDPLSALTASLKAAGIGNLGRHGYPPAPHPDTILLGSVNGLIVKMLNHHECEPLRNDLFGAGGPFRKYLIPLEPLGVGGRSGSMGGGAELVVDVDGDEGEDDLPQGMRYAPVPPEEYDVIMQYNRYIRSAHTLEGMKNLGIRTVISSSGGIEKSEEDHEEHDEQELHGTIDKNETQNQNQNQKQKDKLIAFAFLGLEGSVRTLHVISEYRGQNLGTKLARRLLRTSYHTTFLDEGTSSNIKTTTSTIKTTTTPTNKHSEAPSIAHCDIQPQNEASTRLFKRLGAVEAWDAYWVRVDLGRAKKWVEDGVVDEAVMIESGRAGVADEDRRKRGAQGAAGMVVEKGERG